MAFIAASAFAMADPASALRRGSAFFCPPKSFPVSGPSAVSATTSAATTSATLLASRHGIIRERERLGVDESLVLMGA